MVNPSGRSRRGPIKRLASRAEWLTAIVLAGGVVALMVSPAAGLAAGRAGSAGSGRAGVARDSRSHNRGGSSRSASGSHRPRGHVAHRSRTHTAHTVVRSAAGVAASAAAGAVGGSAGGSASGGGSDGGGVSPAAEGGASPALAAPPVIAGSPVESEQIEAGRQAKLASPEAVAERELSSTKFENEGPAEAAKTDGEAFSGLMDEPAGGPPQLPAGESIVGYPTDDAAQVDLPEGKHAVIESTEPLAVETSPGQRAPIDLGLREAGGAVEAVNPLVPVRLPKHLSEGAQLPGLGVSLTPVGGGGASVGDVEGSLDGAGVFFANTQSDADTVVKPSTFGFSVDALLRSGKSPRQLYFSVGLPAGASLVQAQGGSGAVRVVDEGSVLAWVLPPYARDAAGTRVPVSMSVSGDVLTLTVGEPAGGAEYPIEVDPSVEGKTSRQFYNWKFYTPYPSSFHNLSEDEEKFGSCFDENQEQYSSYCEDSSSSYSVAQWAEYFYETQGQSRIYALKADTEQDNGSNIKSTLRIQSEAGDEKGPVTLSTSGKSESTLCVSEGCGAVPVEPEAKPKHDSNGAYFEQEALVSGSTSFWNRLTSADVSIEQEAGPSDAFDTADSQFEVGESKFVNALAPGVWVSSSSQKNKLMVGLKAYDPGLGVKSYTVKSPSSSYWTKTASPGCDGVQCIECFDMGEHCASQSGKDNPIFVQICEELDAECLPGDELPQGEDTVEGQVEDPVGLKSTVATAKIKVDMVPPHSFVFSGVTNGGEIEAGTTNVKVEATDGEGSTPSSGVKSIAIAVDGHEIGKPNGYCSPGPCTAKGEWIVNGDEFSDGEHKLLATAIDNAGNVATDEISFKVHHGASVSVGPGSIESISGELSLNATDVSVSAPGSGLAVHRSYRSRHLTAGAEGPLGPQWALSVGGQESIAKLSSGNATLTTSNGAQTTFASNGKGGFTAPTGDAGLSLSEVKNEKGELTEYVLTDASDGVTIRFTSSSGSTASLWKPTKQEGPVALQTVRYIYQTVEGVTRPTYAIAPEPAGLSFSCVAKAEKGEKLEKGCRALEFKYASATTATGEGKGEWGEYKERLKEVLFVAYNPSSKAMAELAVAQYSYDKQGRLRAVWNPQISPALKTVYGYDSEGHVTALTAPGQESWALTYGTIAGDSNTGRLLKATQAPASAKLWGGEAPKNTEAPKLSGSLVGGEPIGVSSGVWSNEPVAYAYQWEECNSAGKECTLIPGATNANYALAASLVGHTVTALVTATNGGGSVVASVTSGEIKAPEISEYSLGGTHPLGITSGPDKNLWFTESGSGKIGKITTSGVITEYSLPSGSEPYEITTGPDENLWFTDSGTSKIGKITTSGTVTEYELPKGSEPLGIAVGPDKNLWFTDRGTRKIGKITTSGSITEYSLPNMSETGYPAGITAGPDENLWFTEYGGGTIDNIGKITTAGVVTEYPLPSGSSPYKIVSGPEKDLWFTDRDNRIGKITTSGVVTDYSLAAYSEPWDIAEGPEKDLWFAEYSGKIGRITPSGAVSEYSLPAGGWPYGVTAGPDGDIWFTNASAGKAGKINPSPTEGEHYAPGPGTTVEYRIPMQGEGLPTMTASEVEKWGQTDDPVEATAVFPPDEPQGWPASSYKRATIQYRDIKGRAVDTAYPGGAISTTEYNADNDVVRTLSPDNRATALKESCESKEKCKSAETSKLLDSESTYKESGSEPGTELLSTLGPQHTVKLTNGTQAKARAHTVYSYDEGAPSEGGPYHLATKMTQGAQIAGKEESEVRTTTTSYSGQENLGWKLRAPTSVTTDPNGLNLTHTTVYNPSTGNVSETRAPESKVTAAYSGAFESDGPGTYEFEMAGGVAVSSQGDIWVLNELEGSHQEKMLYEFNEKEEFIRAAVALGSRRPSGIAVDAKGEVWVDDGATEVFNEKGEYEKTISAHGYMAAAKGDVWIGGDAYNESGELVKEVKGMAGGPEAIDAKGDFWVATRAGLYEYNEKGEELRHTGGEGSGLGQFEGPRSVAVGPEGNVWVSDEGSDRVEEFNEKGEYGGEFGSRGTGKEQFGGMEGGWPMGMAVDGKGNVYVTDNEWVEKWTPAVTGNPGARDTQTVYYSANEESEVVACRKHPEWANLPCETRPAAQPGTSRLPELPVTTVASYNIWDEPEKTEETVGATTRTKTSTYDGAGRLKTSAISSTVGAALPTITNEYSSETGALVKQCANEGKACGEGKPKTITSAYNALGELTSYTDADEVTTTYEYEGEGTYKGEKEQDGRLRHVNDGKGTETYTYNETTGFLSELLNEYGTTKLAFTATYDTEGNPLTEGYPNGMNADYAYDATGAPTSLEYIKTTHCTEKCTWFSDSVVPSIHGQWLEQTSTLSHQVYAYDAAGRLTQVQNTPAGKGCTTRVYAYEEDTNRTSLTTREPNAKDECTSAGGTTETHSYDTASRLADPGVSYSTFGDITTLPAADAGGSELTSTYYTDNQLDTQTQNGQTIGYNLDPAGRTLETVATGKRAETVTNHYAGPGSSPAWTVNTSGETTRNIAGIGGFAAVQSNTEAPVLQITNLHGDIIGTAYASETATGLASSADTSEFGVPTTSLPPKYSWLGADEIPTELPSGVLDMGARSYVPQLGRFLQPDPRPGGSANAYTYTFGDPVNTSDPSGESAMPSSWSIATSAAQASESAAIRATEIREAEEAAKRAAEEAAARMTAEANAQQAYWDSLAAGPQYEGEEEEWWEEEEGEEYAAYHSHAKNAQDEVHLEGGLSSEPFGEAGKGEGEERSGDGGESGEVMARLCEGESSGPCALLVSSKRSKFHKWIPTCPSGTSFDEFTHKCEERGPEGGPGYKPAKVPCMLDPFQHHCQHQSAKEALSEAPIGPD